jgi:hypothetical protein
MNKLTIKIENTTQRKLAAEGVTLMPGENVVQMRHYLQLAGHPGFRQWNGQKMIAVGALTPAERRTIAELAALSAANLVQQLADVEDVRIIAALLAVEERPAASEAMRARLADLNAAA